MQHRDYIVIKKIIDEIEICISLLGDSGQEDFRRNEMCKRAVCMTVINIGELVKNLTMDARKEYSDIPWKEIAGFRDITAHRYQTLNIDDVYVTVKDEFPSILNNLKAIIEN